MFSSVRVLVLLLAASVTNAHVAQEQEQQGAPKLRKLGMMMKSSMYKKKKKTTFVPPQTVTLKVTNLAFQQPFSGVFVMTHNAMTPPLFTLGEMSSEPLALLAEDGK